MKKNCPKCTCNCDCNGSSPAAECAIERPAPATAVDLLPASPPAAGRRLYPDIVPPGTVQSGRDPLLIGAGHLPMCSAAGRLPPLHFPPNQPASSQPPPPPPGVPPSSGPPPYFESAGLQQPSVPAGVGIRYFVHGTPQSSEFHAVHAMPGGCGRRDGEETVFYYISSCSSSSAAAPRCRQPPSFFILRRRRLSYASFALFCILSMIFLMLFIKMHADLNHRAMEKSGPVPVEAKMPEGQDKTTPKSSNSTTPKTTTKQGTTTTIKNTTKPVTTTTKTTQQTTTLATTIITTTTVEFTNGGDGNTTLGP